MKAKFVRTWIRSKKPRKQRKFLFNAPIHIKKKLICATLSKDLRQKHNMRSLSLRTGDKVKIMRGDHKGFEGKVESISVKNMRIYLTGLDFNKKDGSKVKIPLKASNLMITSLGEEKDRFKKNNKK